MIEVVKPKFLSFICTTAHPAGCEELVRRQIDYVKSMPPTGQKRKVLVIGSSTGYGLSSRICAAWADGSPTIGVCFEKQAFKKRTATAGWYNTAAFEKFAAEDGLYAKTINGDAFSKEVKDKTVELIKKDWGKADVVIYSLAAPRRTMADGTVYSSVLKTKDRPFTSKNLDIGKRKITQSTILPANAEEIEATIKVMGGEDWYEWMHTLKAAGVLADDAVTVAYSYIGPELTYPIYFDGTIGQAKKHLYETALKLQKEGMNAYISVNKALVTQSSAAIPIVPLYLSILYKVMKEAGVHEGTVEQMYRLWHDQLSSDAPETDAPARIRLDDYEMRPDIQEKVMEGWNAVSDDNLTEYTDIDGYWEDLYQMFGFGFDHVDYDAAVETAQPIPSVEA